MGFCWVRRARFLSLFSLCIVSIAVAPRIGLADEPTLSPTAERSEFNLASDLDYIDAIWGRGNLTSEVAALLVQLKPASNADNETLLSEIRASLELVGVESFSQLVAIWKESAGLKDRSDFELVSDKFRTLFVDLGLNSDVEIQAVETLPTSSELESLKARWDGLFAKGQWDRKNLAPQELADLIVATSKVDSRLNSSRGRFLTEEDLSFLKQIVDFVGGAPGLREIRELLPADLRLLLYAEYTRTERWLGTSFSRGRLVVLRRSEVIEPFAEMLMDETYDHSQELKSILLVLFSTELSRKALKDYGMPGVEMGRGNSTSRPIQALILDIQQMPIEELRSALRDGVFSHNYNFSEELVKHQQLLNEIKRYLAGDQAQVVKIAPSLNESDVEDFEFEEAEEELGESADRELLSGELLIRRLVYRIRKNDDYEVENFMREQEVLRFADFMERIASYQSMTAKYLAEVFNAYRKVDKSLIFSQQDTYFFSADFSNLKVLLDYIMKDGRRTGFLQSFLNEIPEEERIYIYAFAYNWEAAGTQFGGGSTSARSRHIVAPLMKLLGSSDESDVRIAKQVIAIQLSTERSRRQFDELSDLEGIANNFKNAARFRGRGSQAFLIWSFWEASPETIFSLARKEVWDTDFAYRDSNFQVYYFHSDLLNAQMPSNAFETPSPLQRAETVTLPVNEVQASVAAVREERPLVTLDTSAQFQAVLSLTSFARSVADFEAILSNEGMRDLIRDLSVRDLNQLLQERPSMRSTLIQQDWLPGHLSAVFFRQPEAQADVRNFLSGFDQLPPPLQALDKICRPSISQLGRTKKD